MTTRDDIERLFRTHYAAMYRLAMLILRDDDVSRDIVHDVFETLLVSGRSDVSVPYLLTAVRNRCLKHIRSLSAQDRMKAVYSVDEREIEDEDWPDDETIALSQSTVSYDLSDVCHRVVDPEYYDCKVAFNNEASKSLRLYFRWNQENTLEEVVERLDNFEQINLTIKDRTIKVD